ncbi:hypothetical protein HKX48_007697 [Thoreauomyces humboldtii]|nr:hypothetical protein HKX48_007697 [Thoreauomyces humboldtii]
MRDSGRHHPSCQDMDLSGTAEMPAVLVDDLGCVLQHSLSLDDKCENGGSLNELRYTPENFPSYARLQDIGTPYLSEARYQRVRDRYLGTLVPPQDDPDYELDIKELRCNSWLECWIVLAIRCD